ncbi:MAG: presqualene diphosphate synthase HpnD [Mariprofundaceae bacterium]|nr:presqualene diphosphate synthase HpnD [Mariprofundaceae bacterium]
MSAAKYCEDKARGSGSSFFYAFLFLPEDQRRAMMALYAFCREVDDIADEVSDKSVAAHKLAFWGEEIARTFADKPRHPVGRELNWARGHFNLNEELFIEILDGMLMDVEGKPMLKASDLALYCHRVAGVVGLLTIEIFGHRAHQSARFASTLGEALQLTNILRDVKEDAARGRIYIPQQDRIRFGVTDQYFVDGNISDGMRELIKYYIDKIEAMYQKAINLLPAEDRQSLRPSLLMGAIYFAHFQRIKKYPDLLWKRPPRLLPVHKIWIAWRMWRYEKRALRKALPLTFAI